MAGKQMDISMKRYSDRIYLLGMCDFVNVCKR